METGGGLLSGHLSDQLSGPLTGLTVLDLGQAYQGPYVGYLMARAGADVIKIEPLEGELARLRDNAAKGALLPFAMLNGNKRSVTLNLKSEAGRELLKSMVVKADVLIENFAPGVMDRLGVGWEVLHQCNPRLVYGSGTGFGLSGEGKDRRAMDLIVQAYSGVMSMTGEPGSPPLKAGPAIADFLGGIHLYAGIMTALFERAQTGRGRLVEIAMQEAVYPSLVSALGLAQGGGEQHKAGNRHSGLSIAPWSTYEAADGYVAIVCVNDAQWLRLVGAMGRADLIGDPRYASNASRVVRMDEVDALVAAWTRGLPRVTIAQRMEQARIPSAPVRELHEVFNDPVMLERGMLLPIEHPECGPITVFDSPLRVHGAGKPDITPSARLGADNQSIYCRWLGLSAEQLNNLVTDGVVGTAAR